MSARRKILNKLVKLFTKGDNLDEPAKGYIYNILDTKNGKNYVGSKLGAIDQTENYLGSGTIISKIAKKRPDDLYKTILGKTSTRREMMTQEEAWLKAMRASQDGNMYNLKNSYRGATGRIMTDSHKAKIGKANTNKTKGIKRGPASDEHKRNISKGKKGIKFSDEHKKALSKGQTGAKRKPMTEEHKRNLSKAKKGVKISPMSAEHKAAISKGNKGRTVTEETRRKISEGNKRQRAIQKGLL